MLPDATDVEKARWQKVGYRVPSGQADRWWRVAEHPESDGLCLELEHLRATYTPLAARRSAQLALEHTVFDTGLAVRRGNMQEPEAIVQIDNAIQRAAAAGLPDDVIDATAQSMALKVPEVIKREQAAAQAQAQRDAVLKIRALTADIQQMGGWQEERHRADFWAAGFMRDPATDTWHHPLAETSKEVADAQDALFRVLEKTLKAREAAEQQRITQILKDIHAAGKQIYHAGYDEQYLLNAGFYGNSDSQWTHHDANDSKVAEAANHLLALVEQVHRDESAIHGAIKHMRGLDGANPADHAAEMVRGKLVWQAGHWQLQGDPNYLSARRNDLIQAYNQAKQRYDALTELRNAVLNQNYAPSREAALSAVEDAVKKAFVAQVSEDTIKKVVYETQAMVEMNRPKSPEPPRNPGGSMGPSGP